MNRRRPSFEPALRRLVIVIALGGAVQPGPLHASEQSLASALGASQDRAILMKPANLHVTMVRLQEALDRLQEQSGVPVAYSPSLLPDHLVTCECLDVTVEEAVRRLLLGTGYQALPVEDQIVIRRRTLQPMPTQIASALLARSLVDATNEVVEVTTDREAIQARQGTITGRIVDQGTLRPLVGVQVQVLDTQVGALTNAEGRYLLINVPAGPVRLRILVPPG